MKCDICGADPMTANCNNANCDTGKPRKCRNCDATAPDWSGNGLCITCARDEVSNTTDASNCCGANDIYDGNLGNNEGVCADCGEHCEMEGK